MMPRQSPPRSTQPRRKSLEDQARECLEVQRRLKEEAAERRKIVVAANRVTPPR
jgi:hypothetical protein